MDIAVIGVGNRARKYLSCLPDGVRVACLVEPDPLRLSQAAARYGVPPDGCFSSSDVFFAAADIPSAGQPVSRVGAVIVAVPDRLHVPLSLRCAKRGWHVLLEKPVALDEAEYQSLIDVSVAAGVHVGVCLEMRFHPYFRRIRQLLDAGAVGSVVSIDHTEHIGPDRMAHTFVRGLWSRKADSGPIFLSKCCHDADFLLWLVGAQGDAVSGVRSEGKLGKFVPDPSAPGRCIDCGRSDCPYSAVSLYRERGEWTDGFDVPSGSSLAEVIDEELRSGRYGRCVFHCDNDVYDSQDVELTLCGGIHLSMHLEGISLKEGRTTVIRGTDAVLVADNWKIELRSVNPSCTELLLLEDYSSLASLPLHGGADKALVADFFRSIAAGKSPSASLQSAFQAHRLCWLAG